MNNTTIFLLGLAGVAAIFILRKPVPAIGLPVAPPPPPVNYNQGGGFNLGAVAQLATAGTNLVGDLSGLFGSSGDN